MIAHIVNLLHGSPTFHQIMVHLHQRWDIGRTSHAEVLLPSGIGHLQAT